MSKTLKNNIKAKLDKAYRKGLEEGLRDGRRQMYDEMYNALSHRQCKFQTYGADYFYLDSIKTLLSAVYHVKDEIDQ